jgi:hypothetical protein
MSNDLKPRTYVGWQPERVAFLLGLSAQRALLLAAAVVLAVQPVAAGNLGGVLLTWPLALLLVACVFTRVAGRTVDEWMITVISFQWLKLTRKTDFLSGAFAPGRGIEPPRLDLPGVLMSLRILTAEAGTPREVAVVHHPHQHTYSAVAVIEHSGLGLADSARQNSAVDAWAGVLASLCTQDNPLTRLQVVHRTAPEPGAALRAWHAEHLDPAAPLASVMVNETLLAQRVPATCRRESWLVVSLDARRAASQIRAAGGGDVGACAVLELQVRALRPVLAAAGLCANRWLAERELAAVIRTGFDPDSATGLAERNAHAIVVEARGDEPAIPAGVDPALAGPAAAESSWSTYRHDGAVSATYAVHAWPISPAYATSLAGLLADASHRRTFSLYIEPLGPREAQRAVQVERTKREVGLRLRARTGQAVTAAETTALARAAAQDREHAAGHGLARFTGYLTITVTDESELPEACAHAEADAALAGIELRRMYGAQDVGFALSLPVGLGLPTRRW